MDQTETAGTDCLASFFRRQHLPELNIQFLDVGQGDGIFITFPNGKTMLVDLGSTKNKKTTKTDVFEYFKQHTKFKKDSRETLDWLILTHGDRDHYNMVLDFIKEFKVTVANLLFGGESSDYKDAISGVNNVRPSGTLPFELNTKAYFGGVEVMVLAINVPATSNSADAWRKNSASIVLRLEYGGESVVLSGDATIDTEKYIVATLAAKGVLKKLKSTVLKVGHHGSVRTSIAPKWIEAIKPEFVFISSDRQGSLSESAKTGYRLPQQLAIDIIKGNTKLLKGEEHTYVSSYDPDDYNSYRDPVSGDVSFTNPHESMEWGERRTWVQFKTKEAIFTTLAVMDLRSADHSVADQGAQYELKITAEGEVSVKTTLEDPPPRND